MYRFGLDFFPVCNPEFTSGEAYFRNSLSLIKEGEILGFESVKTIEHHATAYGGYSPNPLLLLSAASQITSRMRLITGCVIPSFWNPVKLAAELSMADAISGGRLEVGFARGFLPHEFELFDRSMGAERALRFREAIDLICKFWNNDSVTFKGDYYQFEQVQIYPPMKADKPKIWIAATHTLNSFKWAGTQGYSLLLVPYVSEFADLREKLEVYREAYRSAGHGEPTANNVMFTMHCCVHEDTDIAIELAAAPMQRYLQAFINTGNFKPDVYKGYADNVIVELMELSYERIISEKRALIGSPDRILDILSFYREYFGAEYFSLQFNFGDMPYETARNSMTWFAGKMIGK
ncbi:LLM class flavin-dependent oxidoreductase [Paenibacillus sp. GCM10027628]|uniref:LLM class flavin-dependent oxidoreductase n=1 Tax=Paenibacillus sp. GCM10027628 TaxID=3273413 RepID=UPI00362A81BD